jgi:uncharacterized phage-associated protein
MSDWSPAVANEFIRRGLADGHPFTQMQLQKLVYIAHGWNLAITGKPLTVDNPQAWDYGPVYRPLRNALRDYGSAAVKQEIKNRDFFPGVFDDDPDKPAVASLDADERQVIDRVYRDYGRFHAYQLSALTHEAGTPWTRVYSNGAGRSNEIGAELIREHFIGLAQKAAATNA